jgi:hypothetical protein
MNVPRLRDDDFLGDDFIEPQKQKKDESQRGESALRRYVAATMFFNLCLL